MANKYYKDIHRDSEVYLNALNQSCRQLKRVFNNNDYLLKLHGINLREQLADLLSQGLPLSYETIRNLKRGTNKTCSLVYINFIAVYWGYSLTSLIGRDFYKRGLPVKCVSVPMCSYIKTNII